MTRGLKVGQVANRTGVSIRTLHYYDEIGLLSPSSVTDAGHRLYLPEDIARLHHIKSLQQLGFSLSEIANVLDSQNIPLGETIRRQITRLKEQIALQNQLCRRLETIAKKMDGADAVSIEELLDSIKEVTMIEQYYTPEQLDYLAKRKEEVGDERIQQVQREWHDLFATVKAEKEKGTDPTSEPMQRLAAKWQALIDEFTGGNKGIESSLGNMYKDNPNAASQYGYEMDSELYAYVGEAIHEMKRRESD